MPAPRNESTKTFICFCIAGGILAIQSSSAATSASDTLLLGRAAGATAFSGLHLSGRISAIVWPLFGPRLSSAFLRRRSLDILLRGGARTAGSCGRRFYGRARAQ